MTFSASDFFDYRLEHLELGPEGLRIMEAWIGSETSWRRSLLELIRIEALVRLSGDAPSRHLALQALAFVGTQDDLELLTARQHEHDALPADTTQLAIAELESELATDEDLAREVRDGRTFQLFIRAIVRRRSRADQLLASGHPPADLRSREGWGVHTVSLFLDNAMCWDDALLKKDGPSWRDLAEAILRGRDFQ